MAILSALSVTDVADLRSEANAFQAHADELKGITDQMFELVDSTNGMWRGEAQAAYARQFDGLRDEMAYLYQMVAEYHDDLEQIAATYEDAEGENTQTAFGLQSDIELIKI